MNKEKMIPEIRFAGFMDNWEQRKLGSLANIVRGASPRPIQNPKWFDDNSDIGWLRISDVTEQNGRIYHLEQKISKAGQEKTRVLTEPHLLLSIAATVGKPVINYVKTGVHDGFLIFLNPLFDREFMFQWLEMFRPKWQKYGQPGSQVNLNSELVKNQEIFVPSMDEQKEISSFFKKLDDTIALHQQLLTDYKQLKKALLQQLFPQKGEKTPQLRFPGFTDVWRYYELSDVALITGGGTPKTGEPKYWNGTIDWYSPTEIGKRTYANGSIKKITEEGLKKSSAKLLPPHKTILFTSRAGIGDMAILSKEGCTNQGFQSLVMKDGYHVYFTYSMREKIKQYALKKSSGSTFLEISGKNLGKIKIMYPSFEEQEKIGNFFKQLDETIGGHEQKLATYQELKKALLQRMFV